MFLFFIAIRAIPDRLFRDFKQWKSVDRTRTLRCKTGEMSVRALSMSIFIS